MIGIVLVKEWLPTLDNRTRPDHAAMANYGPIALDEKFQVGGKELLGHSTIVVTMRYAHTNDEAKEKAVKSVSGSDRVVTMMAKPRRFKQ